MILIILQILTIILPGLAPPPSEEEVWKESFSVPEKGIWGTENSELEYDFSGITKWSLDYTGVEVSNPEDYAKTVSTSGGRFECRDIEGEVTWRSEVIEISAYEKVNIHLTAYETGSGNSTENKYLKAYYMIDNGEEIPFETNSINTGNWGGSVLVQQKELKGNNLQIICYMANYYSGDKVTLDEVTVTAEINYPEIEPGDAVINEILFNPVPDGNDYVEIINISEKELPAQHLYLASRNNNFELTQIYPVTEKRFNLVPGAFLALT